MKICLSCHLLSVSFSRFNLALIHSIWIVYAVYFPIFPWKLLTGRSWTQLSCHIPFVFVVSMSDVYIQCLATCWSDLNRPNNTSLSNHFVTQRSTIWPVCAKDYCVQVSHNTLWFIGSSRALRTQTWTYRVPLMRVACQYLQICNCVMMTSIIIFLQTK